MKKNWIALIALLALSGIGLGFCKERAKAAGPGFAVIELFTSEGCSSCPPADEAVAAIAQQRNNNVFILGYHVDYWNYLGWKDAYSNSAYSARQKKYGNIFQLSSIYTPEIVVNGKTGFVGSDRGKLQQTIAKELTSEMIRPFDISANSADSKNVTVTIGTPPASGDLINIALVQLQAESAVQRGENKGKQLHHINIVRDLKTVDAFTKSTNLNFLLPDGKSKNDFTIIAFSQNKNNLQIDNATQINIQ